MGKVCGRTHVRGWQPCGGRGGHFDPAAHGAARDFRALARCPQNSAVGFLVQLRSGQKLQVHIYLCYDRDQAQPAPGSPADTKSPPAPTAPAAAAPAADQPVPASEGASQEGAAEVAFAPMTGEHSW